MMKYSIFLCVLMLSGCEKPNSKPTYGETGLPKNCRAIVQAQVDGIKEIRKSGKDYGLQLLEIDDYVDSIERNCGKNGYSWEYK